MSGFTPLIQKIEKNVFITFQSALEDFNFANADNSKDVNFSHFALLKLPKIQTPTTNRNTIQFGGVEGHQVKGLSTATPFPEDDIEDLSESIQNYLLNLEALITSESTYDKNEMKTVSERIFWKWLKEIGAVRFKTASETESLVDDRFTEEKTTDGTVNGFAYDRVVQYVGEIDMEGSNNSSVLNSTKEIYIYIPNGTGSTPNPLFKTVSDANYYPSKVIKKSDIYTKDYILGQDSSNEVTDTGLRTLAFYDMDLLPAAVNYNVESETEDIWFSDLQESGPECYFTEPVFTSPDNKRITRTIIDTDEEISYVRNNLDGISLDFDLLSYKESESASVKSFANINALGSSSSFEFNVILLYYTIRDKFNSDNYAINLYGFLVVDDLVSVTSGISKLNSFVKIKQDDIVQQQGNSYGFRLNFKSDASYSKTVVKSEYTINPYNTFTLDLFMELMNRTKTLMDNYESVIESNKLLFDRNTGLISIIQNQQTYTNLVNQLASLNSKIDSAIIGTGFTGLLDKERKRIDDILKGNTTVDLSFKFNMKTFDGLKSEIKNNDIHLRNTRQQYSSSGSINLYTNKNSSARENVLKLNEFTNLYYHKNDNKLKTANDHIIIYIEDGEKGWTNNQSLVLAIEDDINFNGFGIVFYTDSKSKFASTPYTKLIRALNVESGKLNHRFEVVCINSKTYDFIVF